MITVLRHGEKDKRVNFASITTRCPECGCVFKFNPNEDYIHSRPLCEDYVLCPDCNERIVIRDTSCDNPNPNRIVCEIVEKKMRIDLSAEI